MKVSLKNGGVKALAAAVFSLLVLAVSVQSSSAQSLPIPGGGGSSIANLLEEVGKTVEIAPGEVQKLLSGDQGALTTVSNLLCPTTRGVDELVEEHLEFTGLGELTGALAGLVCSLGLVEYEFRTVWRAPDGSEITRTHSAIVGIPTRMDVGDTPGPDITGTIGFSQGLNMLTLRVERTGHPDKHLPLQVEAMVSDSSSNVLDDRTASFGFDARHDTAPLQFALSTPVASLTAPDGDFAFVMGQNGSQSLALIGGLFSGSADDRQNPTDVRLEYGVQAPSFAQVRARLGERVRIDLESDRTAPAEISARLSGAGGLDTARVSFEDLPQELSLEIDPDQTEIAYQASAPVDRIEAQLSGLEDIFMGARHLEAVLLDIPTAFTVRADQSEDGSVGVEADNPIGQIDLRARSDGREYPQIPDGEAGLILNATDHEIAFALRVFELERLMFSPDPLRLESRMQGGNLFTIDAQIDGTSPFGLEGGTLSANAVVDRMPSRLALALDSDAGELSYDASQTVDRIEINASSTEEIAFGASHLRLRALEIPESFVLGFGQDADGTVAITADNPIGQLDVKARSEGRDFPEIPAGEAGAILDATEGELAFALRVFELRRLAFSANPIAIESRMAGGRTFTVEAKLDESGPLGIGAGTLELEGVFDALPADMLLTVDPDQGTISYNASEPMDRLELDASSSEPLIFNASHFQARALDIPEQFELAFGQGADGSVGVQADNPIGQLDIRARSEGRDFPEIPAGEAGAILDATEGELAFALRVFELRELTISPDPIAIQSRMQGGRVFTVDARLDETGPLGLPGGELTLDAVIDRMPDELRLAFEPDPGRLSYEASQPVDRIEANVVSTEALLLNANRFHFRALDVPTSFRVGAGVAGDRIGFDADNPIGQLDVRAASEGRDLPEIPDGEAGAILDATGGELAFALRAFGLERLAVNPDPLSLEARLQGGHVFTVNARVDQGSGVLAVDAVLDRMPSRVELGFDPANGKLTYDASAGMDRLSASVDSPEALLLGITEMIIEAQDVPESFELGAGLAGDRFGFIADNPIGQLDLRARSAGRDFPEIADGEAGAILDATAGELGLALRAFELRRLAIGQDPIALEARMQGGRIFTVDARLDETSPLGFSSGELSLNAVFDRMPSRLDFTVDPQTGTLIYDASEEMDRLEASLEASEPVFFGISEMRLRALDIPEAFELAAGEDEDGRIGITADNPIGQLDLQARSPGRDFPEIADGEAGAILDLTENEIGLAVRAFELRRAAFSQEPLGLELGMQGGRVFTVDAKLDETGPFGLELGELSLNAVFDRMPSRLDATVDPESGVLTYDASAPMDRLEATVASTQPVLLGASDLYLRALGVPEAFELSAGQDEDGRLSLVADNPIGQLDIQAASPGRDFPVIPSGEAGIVADLTGDELALALRTFELREVTVSQDPLTLRTRMQGGRIFTVDARLDLENGPLHIEAELDRMPSEMEFSLDPDSESLAYQASSPMDRLEARIDTGSPFLFGAREVYVRALDVPASFELTAGQDEDGGIELASDNPIGQLDVQARSENRAFPEIPGGEAGAILDATEGELALALRVFQLERVALSLEPIALSTRMEGGRIFTIDAQLDQTDDLGLTTGTMAVNAVLDKLPAELSLGIDSESGQISYEASDVMDRLFASISTSEAFLLGGNHFEVEALDVPSAFELGLGQDAEGLELVTDNPIGQLDLRARSDDRAFPVIPAGEAGAILDATAGELALALRVFQLERIAFSIEPITLETKMDGGRVFTVDAQLDQTDDLTGLPTGTLSLEATLDQIPSEVSLGLDPESGEISYQASDTMDRLEAAVSTTEPILMNGNHFEIRALDVPSSFALGIGQDQEGLELSTDNPIGQLDMRARSDNRSYPEIPAGEAGAVLDSTDGELALALRTFDLRRIAFSTEPIVLEVNQQAGVVFSVDANLDRTDDDTGLPMGTLSIEALLDELPSEVRLAVDAETGEINYEASAPMDRLLATVSSPEALLMNGTEFDVRALGLPTSFDVALDGDSGEIGLSANAPVDQLDIKARSENRAFPEIPAGEAGAILDSTNDELALALRVFELRSLGVTLEPISLTADLQGGRLFTVDAKLDRTDEDTGLPLDPLELNGIIDRMPSQVSIGLTEHPEPPEGPGGSTLALEGSAPINFVRLNVVGPELLEGADHVTAEINNLPTSVEIDLPEGEGEPLARINANNHIGQLRLAAHDGSGSLPANSLGNPSVRDLFQFRNLPGDLAVALRLTAIRELSVNLDPVNLSLRQNQPQTRPIDLDAALDFDGETVDVAGLLNRPGTTTDMSVQLDPDQPAALVFDNSHNMSRFELHANGLSGIDQASLVFDNLSRRMTICMDPGVACQRPNPHGVQRYGGSNVTAASMNFDDHGTHGSGSGPNFRTTLNASISFEAGNPITIENLRFRNLGFDLVDSNNPHSSNCGSLPRMSIFFDSRSHPFVMNALRYPPQINLFRLGTDSNPARAHNRISRLNGWSTGFFGCLGGFNQSHAGGLSCGGASELRVQTALGNINILSFLTFNFNICGGSVPNPQPW